MSGHRSGGDGVDGGRKPWLSKYSASSQRLRSAARCQSASSSRLGSLYLLTEKRPSAITFPLQTRKKKIHHAVIVHVHKSLQEQVSPLLILIRSQPQIPADEDFSSHLATFPNPKTSLLMHRSASTTQRNDGNCRVEDGESRNQILGLVPNPF